MGINEWIFNLIKEEYDLFSGNSSYNYAFGKTTLNDYLKKIENVSTEKYSNERPYTPEQVVKAIKNLIEFFTDEKNKTRNIIIDEINHKLENMKKLIEMLGEWINMAKASVVFTKDNEYYTPKSVIDYFGKFDYDPATCYEKAL